MDKENLADELALETEASQAVKVDEIRSKIITDLGFDETVDGEKIDKLVQKEVESHKKLSQAIGQKRKYREEAEKNKTVSQKENKTENGNVSIKDLHALRDIHEDDVDEIVEYAQFKKITVADAKKSPAVQAILADKAEKRATAQATNTSTVRRTTAKVTGEALAERASKGDIPEDDADIASLVKAQFDAKRRK